VTIDVDVLKLTLSLNALLLMLERDVAGFPIRGTCKRLEPTRYPFAHSDVSPSCLIQDVTNLHCWLATMPPPPLDSRGIRLGVAKPSLSVISLSSCLKKLVLNVTCIACSSPGVAGLSEWLTTVDATSELTDAANRFLNFSSELLGGSYFEVAVDRMLNQAPRRCPHRAEFDEKYLPIEYETFSTPHMSGSTTSVFLTLAIILVVAAATVALVASSTACLVRRRNRSWVAAQIPEKVVWLWRQQTKANAIDSQINSSTMSIFRSPVVPLWMRFFMPVVIVGNTAFFLSGHISLGATVLVEAAIADDAFTVSKFFEFSVSHMELVQSSDVHRCFPSTYAQYAF
jgi:hypothetical protein